MFFALGCACDCACCASSQEFSAIIKPRRSNVVMQAHADAWHDLLFNRLVQLAEIPPDFDTGAWV